MDRIKVCILALDALEYELVDRFYCENLKQGEYGRIDLTEFKQHSPTGEPFTPVIWSSLLAFYLTNTSLGLKNPRMTDFYGIIAEKLGSELDESHPKD